MGDDRLIEARGIHQGTPIDARGATTTGELQAVGRADMERHLRRLRVDDDVDFEHSPRIDEIIIYLDDPFVYSTTATPTRHGGGARLRRRNGGGLHRKYGRRGVADRARARRARPALDAQLTWQRRSEGNAFNVPYSRTRLLTILEQAVLAGDLVLHYELDPTTSDLTMTAQRERDRTVGSDRIVLVDGGETIDADSILPGDRVERELVVGAHAVGASRLMGLSTLLASSYGGSGVPVSQRQIRIDNRRGVHVRLSTGDFAQRELDIERHIIDLSSAARNT